MTGQPSKQGDWTAWPWMSGYGFSYDNLDQSAVEQAFTLASDWSAKGYIAKDSVSWGLSATFDRWVTGDVAFMQNLTLLPDGRAGQDEREPRDARSALQALALRRSGRV
jgi:hypothetical protein